MINSILQNNIKAINQIVFSFSKNKPQHFQFIDLSQLKKAVNNQHFFVRKYFEEITQQLIFYIRNNQWKKTKIMLNIIQINEIDSWRAFRKISKAINQSCNNLNYNQQFVQNIGDIVGVMASLHFQPKKLKLIQKQNEFDDSTKFLDNYERYIKQIKLQNEIIFRLLRKTLDILPQLFLDKKNEIQLLIIKNIDRLIQKKQLYQILTRGCISNFWSVDFKKQILNISMNRKDFTNIDILKFVDINIPTVLSRSMNVQNIKSENEILNILNSFGYDVQQNIQINGYEIDFLLGGRLIIEYNGHHHYMINSNKFILSSRDQWKYNILRKRKFGVCTIPFYQWKYFKFQEKYKYIVEKIENTWMEQYSNIYHQ